MTVLTALGIFILGVSIGLNLRKWFFRFIYPKDLEAGKRKAIHKGIETVKMNRN